jgi:hypothetical protein
VGGGSKTREATGVCLYTPLVSRAVAVTVVAKPTAGGQCAPGGTSKRGTATGHPANLNYIFQLFSQFIIAFAAVAPVPTCRTSPVLPIWAYEHRISQPLRASSSSFSPEP